MTEPRDVETLMFRRAVRVALLDLLGALAVAIAGVTAAILAGLEVHGALAVLIAAGLAGEQLWRRRAHLPSELPTTEVEATDVDEGPVRPWGDLATAFGIAAVLLGIGLLMRDGGGNVLIGFVVGYALREAATVAWIAAWERHHGRRLVWRGEGDATHAGVLAQG